MSVVPSLLRRESFGSQKRTSHDGREHSEMYLGHRHEACNNPSVADGSGCMRCRVVTRVSSRHPLDVSSLPLDLWAGEKGYRRLRANLLRTSRPL